MSVAYCIKVVRPFHLGFSQKESTVNHNGSYRWCKDAGAGNHAVERGHFILLKLGVFTAFLMDSMSKSEKHLVGFGVQQSGVTIGDGDSAEHLSLCRVSSCRRLKNADYGQFKVLIQIMITFIFRYG